MTITEPKIERVLQSLLHASPTNPRKHFDASALAELSASIEERGIKQPLLVRPSKVAAGHFEIVAGERRWRANCTATERVSAQGSNEGNEAFNRLMSLPCIVEDLSDQEVLELQLIENLQRKDLSPLEEAEAYEYMLQLTDPATGEKLYTVEIIAEKLGRSASDIRKARKWTRLPELARRALEMGICGKEHATIISRIPDELARRKATIELLFFPNDWLGNPGEEDIKRLEADARKILDKSPHELQPVSVISAREVVAESYMSSLDGQPFSLSDEHLLPVEMSAEDGERCAGGSCMDCPFRTGSGTAFADEVSGYKSSGKSSGLHPNICTKPSCLARKLKAHASDAVAEARQNGTRVIEGPEAIKILNERGGLRHGSSYVDLSDKPGFDLVGHVNDGKVKTWATLLKGLEVPVALLVDDKGAVYHVAERDQAVLAVNMTCITKGKDSPFTKAQKPQDRPLEIERSTVEEMSQSDLLKQVEARRKEQNELEAKERKRQAEEKKLEHLTVIHALRMVRDKVAADGIGVEAQLVLLNLALSEARMDGMKLIAEVMDVKPEPKKGESLNEMHYVNTVMELVTESGANKPELVSLLFVTLLAMSAKWRGVDAVGMKAAFKELGLALTEAKLRAKESLKPKKTKAEAEKLTTVSRSECVQRNADITNAVEKEELKPKTEGELVLPQGWEMFQGELVRKIDNYKCDKCGEDLSVPPGQGAVCCRVPVGHLLCNKDGGAWVLRDDFEKLHGLGKYATVKVQCAHCKKPFTGTAASLDEHLSKCSKKPLKPSANESGADPAAKAKGGKREADPEAEAKGLAAYLETGSLQAAADSTGIKLGTLQNWHKRRGWAAKRK